MLPVMSGSSLGSRKWLDAPVFAVALKRTGSGLVWDARNDKPTPDGGMERTVAEPGGCCPAGLYASTMVVEDRAGTIWPELARR